MASSRKSSLRIIAIIAIATGGFILSFLLMFITPVQNLQLKHTDQLFEYRGPLDVSDSPIVLVAISQQADEEIPQKYPWPTDVYARLVHNLNEAGAKVIAFDVIFDNPDIHDVSNDTLFAQAMQEHGNVILSGEIQRIITENSDSFSPMFPIPILNTSNPNQVALVQVYPDLDGAVRTYRFGHNYLNTNYYRLGLEAIREYKDISYDSVDPIAPSEDPYFELGPYRILKDRPNSFYINYYGPEHTFPEISLEEVIDDSSYNTVFESELGAQVNSFDDPNFGHLAQETFKDKIVLVGATMPLLKDFYATPFANQGNNDRPGYQVHAHAIQTILDGNYISRFSGWYTLLIMFFFCLSIALITHYFNANWGILFSIVGGSGFYGISFWAFLNFHVLMVVTGPLLAIIITQVGMVSYEYYLEQKEKRRIKGMFASYVSPELVDQMVESGEEPQLGGEETYMTAFFSDIVSFSTFSEQLEAKDLVRLINEYLNAMTNILNDRGGTLDKYIGDAIVSFFGSPVYMQDHAYQACISSQLMHRELDKLRKKWKKDGWPEIVVNMQHRIGVNTGVMVTGNMGSTRRFNYTMMGDNVNLAARCESGAKKYGVYTMVTETTKQEAEKFGDDCVFRLLDNIVVKGRTKPVKVYEIIGLKEHVSDEMLECKDLFEEGIHLYFDQNWDAALQKFNASQKLERNEMNPSRIFIERTEMMKSEPPEEDWDGVFIMKSK
jgi:adenylate cyclase